MKKQIACALLMSTLSFSSLYASDVCTDPLQKICSDTKSMQLEREAKVKKLKSEISAEAERNAAPRIEEMKKKTPKFRFIRRMIQAYKIKNQEIMRSAKVRVGDLEKVITNPENISKLKSYMSEAVDQTNFNSSTKDELKSVVSSVVIGNFADFIEKTGLEDNVIAQLLSNACGSDGLIDNAFATTLDNQKYVLVCPGFLITLNQESNEKDRFNTMLQAISHEIGHHIDNSKVGNEIYRPYLDCLSKNHIDRFNKTKDDQKFCKANEKEPAKCSEKVVLSHAGELIADQWGIKVTAIHAKHESLSFGESEKMLTESWVKLCGSQDEGIHPTGDFRIGTLMRFNPNIVDTLSCSNNETTKPVCTFDGELVN